MEKIRVAVIGTGKIGMDLCERLLLDDRFTLVGLIGRRTNSEALLRFRGKIEHLLDKSAESLKAIISKVDGVFDATSAFDHLEHWTICKENSVWAIDLTPSEIGTPFVPSLMGKSEGFQILKEKITNYSMITCGGQSSAPLIYSFAKHAKGIHEVEISSSIASLSAGPATRRNIDQYVNSTEGLAAQISKANKVKAILVINPSIPPVMMRTTVQMSVDEADLNAIKHELAGVVSHVQESVPGYELIIEPHFPAENILSATVKVVGSGFFLPSFAGNLDIINAAAVETAKLHFDNSTGNQ
jgi:acetaldehyde dehydrogenase (acetylating)